MIWAGGSATTVEMATQVTIGKARLVSFVVRNSDGSVNTTADAIVGSGNSTTMRATLNPTNPREFAVVGLAVTSGVNANVFANGKTVQTLIEVNASTAPDQSGVEIGEFGPETDPPVWA